MGLTARWFVLPLDRKRTEYLLAISALAVPATAAAEFFALNLSRIRPLKYDEYIYRIDAAFGEPSFMLGRLVAHHRSLTTLVSVTYGLLPIAIIGTFAVYLLL